MTNQTTQGYLSHVDIRGFRSLQDVSVELSPLTVLIGANGSGKSNFIKFFALIRWLMDGRSLKEWTMREGGADDQLFMGSRSTEKIFGQLALTMPNSQDKYQYETVLGVSVNDQLHFAFEYYRYQKQGKALTDWIQLTPIADFSALPTTIKPLKPEATRIYAKGNPAIITTLLKQCSIYQFQDTSKHAAIKKAHDTSDSVYLNADGGNLAAVLLNLKDNYPKHLKLIERQISRVLPSFDSFVLEPEYGKVMLRWRHKHSDKIIGAHLTSDGSLRLFCLITLLNLPKEKLPAIIFLDEPELGLHPNAITLIAAMIRTVSAHAQIILATQSPFMVDCFELDNIVVADLIEGATRLRRLDQTQYQQWLADDFSVADLWLSNVLGGQP